jgi:hypothetical protein
MPVMIFTLSEAFAEQLNHPKAACRGVVGRDRRLLQINGALSKCFKHGKAVLMWNNHVQR